MMLWSGLVEKEVRVILNHNCDLENSTVLGKTPLGRKYLYNKVRYWNTDMYKWSESVLWHLSRYSCYAVNFYAGWPQMIETCPKQSEKPSKFVFGIIGFLLYTFLSLSLPSFVSHREFFSYSAPPLPTIPYPLPPLKQKGSGACHLYLF